MDGQDSLIVEVESKQSAGYRSVKISTAHERHSEILQSLMHYRLLAALGIMHTKWVRAETPATAHDLRLIGVHPSHELRFSSDAWRFGTEVAARFAFPHVLERRNCITKKSMQSPHVGCGCAKP